MNVQELVRRSVATSLIQRSSASLPFSNTNVFALLHTRETYVVGGLFPSLLRLTAGYAKGKPGGVGENLGDTKTQSLLQLLAPMPDETIRQMELELTPEDLEEHARRAREYSRQTLCHSSCKLA
jgi:hypothetical protein